MNELRLVAVNLSICWFLSALLLGPNWILEYQKGRLLPQKSHPPSFTPPTPLSRSPLISLCACGVRSCCSAWYSGSCSAVGAECIAYPPPPACGCTQKTQWHLDSQRLVWGQLIYSQFMLVRETALTWHAKLRKLTYNSDLQWSLSRTDCDLGPWMHHSLWWSHIISFALQWHLWHSQNWCVIHWWEILQDHREKFFFFL